MQKRWYRAKKIKIGILGGSFNPAHAGHLYIAEQSLKHLQLDKILLVVSPQNPLKQRSADFETRYDTAKSLVKHNPYIQASDLESKLMIGSKKYYTYNFLKKLAAKYRNNELTLIIGADNLITFHKWYKWQEICQSYKIAVFPRLGYNYKALRSKAYIRYNESFKMVHVRQLDISSTAIRALKNSL